MHIQAAYHRQGPHIRRRSNNAGAVLNLLHAAQKLLILIDLLELLELVGFVHY